MISIYNVFIYVGNSFFFLCSNSGVIGARCQLLLSIRIFTDTQGQTSSRPKLPRLAAGESRKRRQVRPEALAQYLRAKREDGYTIGNT